jgi:hypothetical protein
MSTPAPTGCCYVCGLPAPVWKITAEKQGEPAVVVLFWTCEKCRPFEYLPAEKA